MKRKEKYLSITSILQPRPFQDLKTLIIDTPVSDKDLADICNVLIRCASNLQTLKLTGLEHGQDGVGIQALVELLKENKNLHSLHRMSNFMLICKY